MKDSIEILRCNEETLKSSFLLMCACEIFGSEIFKGVT